MQPPKGSRSKGNDMDKAPYFLLRDKRKMNKCASIITLK